MIEAAFLALFYGGVTFTAIGHAGAIWRCPGRVTPPPRVWPPAKRRRIRAWMRAV